jgi:hypothetical protein
MEAKMNTPTKTKSISEKDYAHVIKHAARILREAEAKGKAKYDLGAAIAKGWAKGGAHAHASTLVVDYLVLSAELADKPGAATRPGKPAKPDGATRLGKGRAALRDGWKAAIAEAAKETEATALLYVQAIVLSSPDKSRAEHAQWLNDVIAGAEPGSSMALNGEALTAFGGIEKAIEEVLLQEAQAEAFANEDVDPCLHVDARTMREITGEPLRLVKNTLSGGL